MAYISSRVATGEIVCSIYWRGGSSLTKVCITVPGLFKTNNNAHYFPLFQKVNNTERAPLSGRMAFLSNPPYVYVMPFHVGWVKAAWLTCSLVWKWMAISCWEFMSYQQVTNAWEIGGRLHFHTQDKAALRTCELSYCCVIVNWQESQGYVVM